MLEGDKFHRNVIEKWIILFIWSKTQRWSLHSRDSKHLQESKLLVSEIEPKNPSTAPNIVAHARLAIFIFILFLLKNSFNEHKHASYISFSYVPYNVNSTSCSYLVASCLKEILPQTSQASKCHWWYNDVKKKRWGFVLFNIDIKKKNCPFSC